MTWTDNFLSHNFFIIFFSKPIFSTFNVTLFIVSRFFFSFSKSAVCTYPSIVIYNFGLEASPCNAISDGRPPLGNTNSESGTLPLLVRIENDSDRKFSKSKFFHSFSGKIFFGFSKSTPRYFYLFLFNCI